jgi:hypothetical protein
MIGRESYNEHRARAPRYQAWFNAGDTWRPCPVTYTWRELLRRLRYRDPRCRWMVVATIPDEEPADDPEL